MPRYFINPFATAGTYVEVPDNTQPSGSVSYAQGWTINYTYNINTNPSAYAVSRSAMNGILFDITSNIQYWQQNNAPAFITSSDNGGSPYSYSAGAIVISGGVYYRSLVNSNTTTPPGGSWQIVNQVINSWGGSTTPVAVTSGTNISIAGGVISFTGGSSFVTPNNLQNQTYISSGDSGTANNMIYAGATPAYTQINGSIVTGHVAFANTGGATTLTVNGQSSAPVKINGATGYRDPIAGEIVGQVKYQFEGDSLSSVPTWVLQNPTPLPIGYTARVTFNTTTTQTISSGTTDTVQFDRIVSDAYGWWDAVNHRWQPTLPGRYEIRGQVDSSGTTLVQYLVLASDASSALLVYPGVSPNVLQELPIPAIPSTVIANGTSNYYYLTWNNTALTTVTLGDVGGTYNGTQSNFFEIQYLGPY